MTGAAYFIERAVHHAGNGDAAQWGVCFAARRIVGEYQRGDTIGLALRLRRSVDTIERMAAAAVVYLSLRRELPQTSELRFCLPYAHFWKLGQAIKRYEFGPLEAIGYLAAAKQEGWSPESMADYIESEQEPTEYRSRWGRKLNRLHSSAEKMLEDVPSYQRKEFEGVIKLLAKMIEELKA